MRHNIAQSEVEYFPIKLSGFQSNCLLSERVILNPLNVLSVLIIKKNVYIQSIFMEPRSRYHRKSSTFYRFFRVSFSFFGKVIMKTVCYALHVHVTL